MKLWRKKKPWKWPEVSSWSANSGCFDGLKNRGVFHHVNFVSEDASADEKTADIFPLLKWQIDEEGYMPDHIFNLAQNSHL